MLGRDEQRDDHLIEFMEDVPCEPAGGEDHGWDVMSEMAGRRVTDSVKYLHGTHGLHGCSVLFPRIRLKAAIQLIGTSIRRYKNRVVLDPNLFTDDADV